MSFSPQELAESSRNLCITGAAGTGKSYLLREVTPHLPADSNICAPTGVAALLVDGCTLHKLAGMGLCLGSAEYLYGVMKKSEKLSKLWKSMKVLIIDEISMCDIGMFVKMSSVISKLRNDPRPWGGIRLILIGDFLQLPPIQMYKEINEETGESKVYKHLFKHPIWERMDLQVVYLTEPKRYVSNSEEDSEKMQRSIEFAHILSDIRLGILSDRVKKLMVECSRKPTTFMVDMEKKLGITPTVLIATNKEVDSYNEQKLKELPGKEYTYEPVYTTASKDPIITKEDLLKQSQTQNPLRLKIGAQVMLLVNRMDDQLANGSRGVVVGFAEDSERFLTLPIVQFMNGKALTIEPYTWSMSRKKAGENGEMVPDRASLKHLPIKLAWATTIHKSQGASMDSVYVSLSSCFAPSHLYVALSRCRNRDYLFVKGWSEDVFRRCMPDQECVEFYNNLPA